MDIALLILGSLLIILGMAGSFLPIIPGPLTSWFGLLSLHYTTKVEQDWHFLGWTLAVALIVMALDYLIPIWGTKAFGGTKAGAVGATVGLIVGLFFPPFGIIFGPFIGALAGELWGWAVGATVGLVVGLFFPPFGIIFGPFIGALAGELSKNTNRKLALKAAFGSLMGFLSGVLLKFIISFIYLLFFASTAWKAFDSWF